MSLTTVERVRHLISAAILPNRQRSVERDQIGTYKATALGRPGFPDLVQLAMQNPSALISVFPALESEAERLVVCEALSEVRNYSTISFWNLIVEHETNEELLACAAIGAGRQGDVALIEKLEAIRRPRSSHRFSFHLGIARLILNDPRGVDHLVEILRQETDSKLSSASEPHVHGPTMQFIALSILKQILPKGPGEHISEWPEWWSLRRDQYRWVNGAALPSGYLAYVPQLSAFT